LSLLHGLDCPGWVARTELNALREMAIVAALVGLPRKSPHCPIMITVKGYTDHPYGGQKEERSKASVKTGENC
jgi:hypothetical protein